MRREQAAAAVAGTLVVAAAAMPLWFLGRLFGPPIVGSIGEFVTTRTTRS